MKKLLLGLLAFLGIQASVYSQIITFTIDTINQTFSFSGTDSGTPMLLVPGLGRISWDLGSNASGGFTSSISSGFSVSPSGSTGMLTIFDAGVSLSFTTSGNATHMLTGNGATFSYAGATSTEKSYIESLTNSDSIPLTTGTGFDPISIAVIAVPEPAATSLALAGVAVLSILGRRKLLRSRESGHGA